MNTRKYYLNKYKRPDGGAEGLLLSRGLPPTPDGRLQHGYNEYIQFK